MAQIEDLRLQTADKFGKYHFLKRTLQLVLSFSLFSLFLCYSSGFCFFPHSFSVFFSTSLFSLFTQTLERKYMFLICNGILAILAKSSVSCSSSPSETDLGVEDSEPDVSANASAVDEEVHMSAGLAMNVPLAGERAEEQEKETEEEEEKEIEEEEELAEAVKPEEQEDGSSNTEKEERESEAFIAEDVAKEPKEESGLVVRPEDEEDASPAANDELNKKFEEFIRKMKEEIRIEAQTQLVAV